MKAFQHIGRKAIGSYFRIFRVLQPLRRRTLRVRSVRQSLRLYHARDVPGRLQKSEIQAAHRPPCARRLCSEQTSSAAGEPPFCGNISRFHGPGFLITRQAPESKMPRPTHSTTIPRTSAPSQAADLPARANPEKKAPHPSWDAAPHCSVHDYRAVRRA